MSDPTSDSTVAELEPVRAFLGCLMRCNAERTRELVAGMRPADVGPGMRGVVFGLLLRIVAAGVAPDPRVLLAEAQRRGVLDTVDKHKQFAHWLAETHQLAPFPESGWFLRTAVLETAYRRAVAEHAKRLAQATETSPIEQLPSLLEPSNELVDLWQRLAADLGRWQRDTTPDVPDVIEHRRAA